MVSLTSKIFQAGAAAAAMLLGAPHRLVQASDASLGEPIETNSAAHPASLESRTSSPREETTLANTYTLNFNIDPDGVQAINGAGQYITIVKSVMGLRRPGPPVAWLTFSAAQTLQVSWEENYWLYATNQQYQAGAQIIATAMTTSPARSGYEYTFTSTNLFKNPVSGQPPGTFSVNNQVGNNGWQFGLAQSATIAGSTTPQAIPINIVPVLNNEVVSFNPEVTVSIFLQSFNNNGVVISEVSGSALTVTLTATAPSASISFDDTNNTFSNAS